MRRSQATTSWDEGLDGLSKLITPDLQSMLGRPTHGHCMNTLDVCLDISFEGYTTSRYRCKVSRANEQLVVVFEQKRPLGGIELRSVLRLDSKVALRLRGSDMLFGYGRCHVAQVGDQV